MELVETADDAAPLVDGVKTDYTDAPEGAGEGVGGVQRAAQRWLREGLDTRRRPGSEAYSKRLCVRNWSFWPASLFLTSLTPFT